MPQFRRVAPNVLKYDVLAQLRSAIVEGQFEPGEHLIEAEIANQIGVSRGPVREAIQSLELEGLVVNIPNKGTFVATFSVKDVRELTSLRGLLEALAIKLALPNITELDIAQLEYLVDQMREAGREGDVKKLVQYDWDFHELIFQKADHTRLYRVLHGLNLQIRYFIHVTDLLFSSLDNVADTHLPILEAIRRKDPMEAETSIVRHITEVGEELETQLSRKEAIS